MLVHLLSGSMDGRACMALLEVDEAAETACYGQGLDADCSYVCKLAGCACRVLARHAKSDQAARMVVPWCRASFCALV